MSHLNANTNFEMDVKKIDKLSKVNKMFPDFFFV